MPVRPMTRFASRQSRYMNRHARSSKHLGHVGVRTEEVVEDGTGSLLYLYPQNGFEISRVYLDLTGVLRVEYRAVEHRRLVVTTVVVFQLRLYLALFQFLFEEARELRQLGVVCQLRYIHVREIELVGHHQRLLLMHPCLRSNRADEQVLRGDVAALTALAALTG